MKFIVKKHIEDLELETILYPGEVIERAGKRAEVFKAKPEFFEEIKELERKKRGKGTEKA